MTESQHFSMSQTFSMFFQKNVGTLSFLPCFLNFLLVKNTSTDTFLCPKLFLKHRKSLEHRNFYYEVKNTSFWIWLCFQKI
jgi:hypothetical protein